MKDIFVDIVDDQDEVIFVRSLSQVVQDGLIGQIRMIKLFIANYDKELLLCRTLHHSLTEKVTKDVTLYDCPLTAIVHAGESYEQAFVRVVQEIFSIDITQEQWHELGLLSRQDGMDCFTQIYELTYNALPDFSQTKFNDFMWEKPLDIITQFAKNSEGEKSLSICLKSFYFDCQDNFSC